MKNAINKKCMYIIDPMLVSYELHAPHGGASWFTIYVDAFLYPINDLYESLQITGEASTMDKFRFEIDDNDCTSFHTPHGDMQRISMGFFDNEFVGDESCEKIKKFSKKLMNDIFNGSIAVDMENETIRPSTLNEARLAKVKTIGDESADRH